VVDRRMRLRFDALWDEHTKGKDAIWTHPGPLEVTSERAFLYSRACH
jgi:hypothetical protein